jgi:hypothetical protein
MPYNPLFRCTSAALAVLAVAFAGTSFADALHASPRYELSRDDRAALERSACLEPHGLKVDRATAYDHRGERYATARCQSHGSVDGQPMHYHVTCAYEDEAWSCFNEVEYLRAKIGSKELYLVAPRARMSEAYGATKYLVRAGKVDLESGAMFDPVQVAPRTIYHVHVEPAGPRAVRIQKHPEWLYVERGSPDGYRELAAAEAQPIAADIEEGRAARYPIYAYFRGHATGDARYFREAFLPTAHIEGNRDGKLVSWTLDEYCALFNGKPAEDEKSRVRSIEYTDVSGDAAIVKATLDHGATVFTDYFVLLKVDGTWKIANKVYSARKK